MNLELTTSLLLVVSFFPRFSILVWIQLFTSRFMFQRIDIGPSTFYGFSKFPDKIDIRVNSSEVIPILSPETKIFMKADRGTILGMNSSFMTS